MIVKPLTDFTKKKKFRKLKMREKIHVKTWNKIKGIKIVLLKIFINSYLSALNWVHNLRNYYIIFTF